MNVPRLNGSARAARINAERNTADMETIYTALIEQAAREASRAFTASTEVTAMTAAGWLVPPEGILLNLDALAASGRFAVVAGPHERFGARGMGRSLYVKDPDGTMVELRHYGTT